MNDKTKQNRQLESARSSRPDEKYIFDIHRPREAQTPVAETPVLAPSQPSDTHQGWRADGKPGEGAVLDASYLDPSVLDSLGGCDDFGAALGDGTRDTLEIAGTDNGAQLDPVSGLPLCSILRMPRLK